MLISVIRQYTSICQIFNLKYSKNILYVLHSLLLWSDVC